MKVSLIALTACCAIASNAFALQDSNGAHPPQLGVTDSNGAHPPQLGVTDSNGAHPPQFGSAIE